jgi:hypothetical protein
LISILERRAGTKPLPVAFWKALRATLLVFRPESEPLQARPVLVPGNRADIPALKGLLNASETLGQWTMGEETLNFLWKTLEDSQPATLIEFGAGLSTLLLATYAARAAAAGREVTLVSIEQSHEEKGAIQKRLQSCGLSSNFLVYPASGEGYAVVPEEIERVLGGKKFDLVVIDGPSGPFGCRTNTLLAAQPFCRQGARWFLDDAYRGSELSCLARWKQTPGITVEGIIPLGHGIATGTVSPVPAGKSSAQS